MAFPAHSKAYSFDVNRALYITDPGPDPALAMHRDAMLHMKNTMTGWGSNPWTVTQSCSLDIGGDPGDLNDWSIGSGDGWGDVLNLYWGFPNRSWIVLEAPSGPGQLLIQLYNADENCVMDWSAEGLWTAGTGPDNAGVPTAPDQTRVYGYGFGAQSEHNWLHARNYVSAGKIHMIHADDGEMDLFLCCASGRLSGFWMHCKAQSPEANWGLPYGFYSLDCDDTRESITYVEGFNVEGGVQYNYGHSKIAATGDEGYPFNYGFSLEGTRLGTGNTDPIGKKWTGVNAIDGNWPMSPVYLASSELQEASGAIVYNAGIYGVIGRVPDFYATASGTVTGQTIAEDPDAGDPQIWAVFGDAVVPWNGTTPEAT